MLEVYTGINTWHEMTICIILFNNYKLEVYTGINTWHEMTICIILFNN